MEEGEKRKGTSPLTDKGVEKQVVPSVKGSFSPPAPVVLPSTSAVVMVAEERETMLVVKEPSLVLEQFLSSFLPSPFSFNSPSGITFSSTGSQLSVIRAPGGRVVEQETSDHQLKSLENKCQSLVPLRPANHLTTFQLDSAGATDSGSQSRTDIQTVPSDFSLVNQLPQLEEKATVFSPLEEKAAVFSQLEEKEQLGEESDCELDLPAEVPSLNTSLSSFEANLQEPPRKIARLSGDEYWEEEGVDDGRATIDQAVPGNECAQTHPSPPSRPPCRQQQGREGRDGGGEGGGCISMCGDQQVVPSDNGEPEKIPSLYGHEYSKLYQNFSERHSPVDHEDDGLSNRPRHCYSCSRRHELHTPEAYPSTVPLNLSRPRLRLGLSKCQRLQPLHHSSLHTREE